MRMALTRTGVAEIEAATKRTELTQQLYLAQLKLQKEATDADRDALVAAANKRMEDIMESSTWPKETQTNPQ